MSDSILQALQSLNSPYSEGSNALIPPNYNSPYRSGQFNPYQGPDLGNPYYGGNWSPSDWGANIASPTGPSRYDPVEPNYDPFYQSLIDLQNWISSNNGFENDQLPTGDAYSTNFDY